MSSGDIATTVESIARAQLRDGCIPWFEGGHADPWDHVEAAMALSVGGCTDEAEGAYDWLAKTQRPNGSWPAKVVRGRIADETLDANFCCYVATGAYHHWLATKDIVYLTRMWPVVERAVDFALDLQAEWGGIFWARDAKQKPWPAALLTSSSSIYLSLRCAIATAEILGCERPDWELSLSLLASAIRDRELKFADKKRFSMDWYYPILSGALDHVTARQRIDERWDVFVVDGLGIRCVSDRPWITTAETCELVLALDRVGLTAEAIQMFTWVQYLRAPDGSYWTGATFPDGVLWPRERTTWSAAAVVLAADALSHASPTSGLFRGVGLPAPLDLSEPIADAL
ncbi:MAG: prenyltransferase [Actinomycetota bacterium]|nr:prenyltransferase [Actinomycetota bacterium]